MPEEFAFLHYGEVPPETVCGFDSVHSPSGHCLHPHSLADTSPPPPAQCPKLLNEEEKERSDRFSPGQVTLPAAKRKQSKLGKLSLMTDPKLLINDNSLYFLVSYLLAKTDGSYDSI